ncbi:hypothetical protein BJX68DRAFT_270597 [Aspergillus pseudodeflectus]|uniref:Uncharacterized protein n=1 Tax=Aspergillus pseudodeflectus TaxID=176178 RepID=A0ABR4JRL5_9EURO
MFLPFLRFIVLIFPPSLTFRQTIHSTALSFKAAKAAGKPLGYDVIFNGLFGLNNRELIAEASDIFVAESDTTATTLAPEIHQLTSNPKTYETRKLERYFRIFGAFTVPSIDLCVLCLGKTSCAPARAAGVKYRKHQEGSKPS